MMESRINNLFAFKSGGYFTVLILNFIICFQLKSQNDYVIKPVPFYKVELKDKFWKPRVETVRTVTIPHTFQKNKETKRIKNFQVAAGTEQGNVCTVFPFDDSDVFKAVEGAAYSLMTRRNPELEKEIDELADIFKAAQEPDGYLYTWRTISEKLQKEGKFDPKASQYLEWLEGDRWKNEDKLSHELYNVGHLYEAAVAYYEATGKRNLLDIALKNAELVYKEFGINKLVKAPGHQEIEVGLIKLYRITKDNKWLDLAKYFLDIRGYGDEYSQNHLKLQDQRVAVGHAVRLGYMMMGAADVTALKNTSEYMDAMKSVWKDIVSSQMYLTGGVGATGSNEGFGGSFDLPNYTAYNETCSSIAFLWWTQRMYQLTGEVKYLDVAELTLYNALNAGLSLSGDKFFYPNPLESRKNTERTSWFSCACCPPNVTRFFSTVGSLMYAQKDTEIFINQFAASKTQITLPANSGKKQNTILLSQETNYPWNGKININLHPATPQIFTLNLRIPGWARGEIVPFGLYKQTENKILTSVEVIINGVKKKETIKDGYVSITRKWKKGDQVSLDLDMKTMRIEADNRVEENAGRRAFQRGPIIYCLEGRDQEDDRVLNLLIPDSSKITAIFESELLGGSLSLKLNGYLVKKTSETENALENVSLKAIPYYKWANRGKDNMIVWIPNNVKNTRPVGLPSLSTKATISTSEGIKGNLSNISDDQFVRYAHDHQSTFVHWWPKFGTQEWLQYSFDNEETVNTSKIYFFDDEAIQGGCRIPKEIALEYLDSNNAWKVVIIKEEFKIEKDNWVQFHFESFKTKALRITMKFREGVSGGVHEWHVN